MGQAMVLPHHSFTSLVSNKPQITQSALCWGYMKPMMPKPPNSKLRQH